MTYLAKIPLILLGHGIPLLFYLVYIKKLHRLFRSLKSQRILYFTEVAGMNELGKIAEGAFLCMDMHFSKSSTLTLRALNFVPWKNYSHNSVFTR